MALDDFGPEESLLPDIVRDAGAERGKDGIDVGVVQGTLNRLQRRGGGSQDYEERRFRRYRPWSEYHASNLLQ